MLPTRCLLTLALASCLLPGDLPAADGNRLTYLDHPCDPYYVHRSFPKLTTPQWIGEEGVEAVVVLAIDDMRDPARYEVYLRPILERLKKIDGRAPVSIMTCNVSADDPQLQTWLQEGLSLEIHTVDHPCPLLQRGDFERARGTYDRCVDLLASVPGNQPVAFRMPCCDSRNTPSPRFWTEIFNRATPEGNFLQIDTSVFNITTHKDPDLSRELTTDADGRERFRKYLPFPSFVNTIEDYPYPYVIGGLCWEFPCVVPSDWEAQNLHRPNNPLTVADMQTALDVAVRKRGTFNLVFHPHGWIRNDQIVELIDHAVQRHGSKVKFLTFREAAERINTHLLKGQTLRAADGGDNGVRLLDVNNDGYIDVVIGNDQLRQTRIWKPETQRWEETAFPASILSGGNSEQLDDAAAEDCRERIPGAIVRFGVIDENGRASVLVAQGGDAKIFTYADGRWTLDQRRSAGIPEIISTRTTAVVLRDVNGNGRSELLVGSSTGSTIHAWSDTEAKWQQLPFALPEGVSLVDAVGGDAGLRFADLNRDGVDDVVFSNGERYSVHLFTSADKGWSRRGLSGTRGEGGVGISPIVRGDGTNNGAWFHSGHLWFQNEQTDQLEDGVDRVPFETLMEANE